PRAGRTRLAHRCRGPDQAAASWRSVRRRAPAQGMEKEHALKESLDAHDGRRGRRTPVRRDGYDGGSLAEVTTALDALRLYLHPEADSTLMNATVTYTVDGQANELAL